MNLIKMLKTTFLFRCPQCSQSDIYINFFSLRPKETCTNCGVRFERDQGNWLMPTAFAYGLGVIFAFILGFSLGRRYGLFNGFEIVLIASTLLFVALIYKPVKSFWVWVLWLMGEVKADVKS
ncbi:MAG: DUF983 domain-containing protein [Deinococcales bacterium]